MAISLCELPWEIWDKIFLELDGQTLAIVQRVCRLWREHLKERHFTMTVAIGMLNSKQFLLSDHPDFALKLVLSPKTPGLWIEIEEVIARTNQAAPEGSLTLIQLAEFQAQLGRRKAAQVDFQEAFDLNLLLAEHVMEGQDYILDRMATAQRYLAYCSAIAGSQLRLGWHKEAIQTIRESIALVKKRMEYFVVVGTLPQACVVGNVFDALPEDCPIDQIIEELGNTPLMHQLWEVKVAVKRGDLQAAREAVLSIEDDAFRSEGWHSIAMSGDFEAAKQVRELDRYFTLIEMVKKGHPVDLSDIQTEVDHAHIEIARRKALNGDAEGAIQVAKTMTDPALKAEALLEGLRELARQGKSKIAIIVAFLENIVDGETSVIAQEKLDIAIAAGHADAYIQKRQTIF